MNEEFSRVLMKQMNYFNSGAGDKIQQVRNALEDTKNIMVENIDKVLERGEKIELLVDKTDRLRDQGLKFEKNSRQLKNAMW
jgi:vesicle-associated membrane protein 7